MVERDGRGPLVGSGTTGRATGSGRGRSRVAGDGVERRPSCIGGIGGVGRVTFVSTGDHLHPTATEDPDLRGNAVEVTVRKD